VPEINWAKLEEKCDSLGHRVIYRWEPDENQREIADKSGLDVADAYAVVECEWPVTGVRIYMVKGYVADRDEWVNGHNAGPLVAHILPLAMRVNVTRSNSKSQTHNSLVEILGIAGGQFWRGIAELNDIAALRAIKRIATEALEAAGDVEPGAPPLLSGGERDA